MDAISRLLKPRSVAVIGASADPTKTAGRPVSYLVKHGFAGEHLPGEPEGRSHRRPDLLSRRGLAAAAPDVGIVLLGAERAHLAVRDLAARGRRRRSCWPAATPRPARKARGARSS